MATKIRTNLSKRSKYYISKERRLELKHFCLQYHEWEEAITKISYYPQMAIKERLLDKYSHSDPTPANVILLESYKRRIDIVNQAIKELNDPISPYIFTAVTTDKTWPYFEALGIGCGRDYFYDRYRKFYYILDKIRI